jgi:general secretion pathway protein E
MLIWGSKSRPARPRPDRRNPERVSDIPPEEQFLTFLLDEGYLEKNQFDRLSAAIAAARFDCLPAFVTELGFMAESDLTAALCRFCDLPALADTPLPDAPLLVDRLSRELCQHKRFFVVAADADTVEIALVDPLDEDLKNAIGYALDRPVRFCVAGPVACDAALKVIFGADSMQEDAEENDFVDDALDRLEDLSRRAPVIRLTNHLFRAAFDHGATDIHIEPGENDVAIRYRVDGMLMFPETYPKGLLGGLTTRLKILASLNIAERRLPQDGRMKLVDRGSEVDVRVSVLPTPRGESVVLRLLGRSLTADGFPNLGFSSHQAEAIDLMCGRPNGLVLVTGPTGSGKTTTLYTALAAINDRTRKIITVEDPVEYRVDGVTQVQVQADIGLDFAAALRSILRQDPDVVMIGEIRDSETARIAVQAALTGHLVLSTLHTNSAAATVTRLIDMGLQPYLLAAVLNGVLAQRLVRRLCADCKLPSFASRETEMLIRRHRPELKPGALRVFNACGCERCGGTGYRGRTVVAEVMEVDHTIREMISDRAPEHELAHYMQSKGVAPLVRAGIDKALAGEVSLDDVIRTLDVGAIADPQGAVA